MHVTIERDALLTALTAVSAVVETRNTIPILSNILLKAEGAQIILTGTDLDIEISATVAAHIRDFGALTVSARTLVDIARNAPARAEISLSLDPTKDVRVKVKAGRSNFSLPFLPAGDFPAFAQDQKICGMSLLPSELVGMIDTIRHAMAQDETRYYLNGAFLHPHNEDGSDYLRLVATDGQRIAMIERPAAEDATGFPAVTVPRKTVNLIRQIIADKKSEITLRVGKARIELEAGDIHLRSKVIYGHFPDYQRFMPRDKAPISAKIRARDLTAAMDAAAIVSTDKVRSLKFSFETSGELRISARNMEAGEAESVVDVAMTGDGLTAGFNGKYVADAAAAIKGPDLEFDLWADNQAARIRDPQDPCATFVVMPLRV